MIFCPKGPHSVPFPLVPVVCLRPPKPHSPRLGGVEGEKGCVLSVGALAPDAAVAPRFRLPLEPTAPLAFQWWEPSLIYYLGCPSP